MSQHNYLVIGLGGTGCAVVRELKKRLYVEWRSRGNSGPYPEVYAFQDAFGGERIESRIATLSVDSNRDDLEGAGERNRGWRVFGETLRLGDREKVLFDPGGIGRILSSVERYPGIEPWIRNEMDFVTEITRGSTEPQGCNQIRRMGRLALANGNSMANVVGAVANRLQELSRGGQVGAEIHVACTLAAGTGSGSVIDTIAQIQRHLRSQSGDFNLFVHGFVTAKNVGSVNTGNFYANQYAALLELNAFRLAIYAPWDIAPAVGGGARRLMVPRPGEATGDLAGTYKSVALISDTTEGGRDVPLAQQVENAAEFLFQLAVRQMGDVPQPLRYALTMEDRQQYPADLNGGNRSTAFIGYGVQRVAIPDREIREKLSYSFARQFTLKVLYHNWDNRYRDSPRSFARDSFVDARRGLWHITREHLCLDLVGEADGQKDFSNYETDWREQINNQAERVRQQLGDEFAGRKEWIADLDRRVDRYWKEGFRSRGEGAGASDYFRIRREPVEIRQRARHLRASVEKDLLTNLERLNGDYPLHHLPAAMEFLVARIEDDRVAFGKQAPEAVEQFQEADRVREEMRQDYVKCGRLARGKQEKIFQNYREACVRSYYWKTIQLAAEYAQEFCTVLIAELKGLQQDVTLFDTRLKLLAKNFEDEMTARIKEGVPEDGSEDTAYVVDARYVNETIGVRFEADKSIQDRQATAAMAALVPTRADRTEFAAYLDRMPVDDADRVGGGVADELRRIAAESAVEAHRKMREDDPKFEGIFGQNIVRKLYTDYGGRADGAMEAWLRELIDKSMPMISFDPNEEPMDLPGAAGPVLRRCVFVPRCKAVPTDFSQQLRAKVESITGARGGCKEVTSHYFEVPEDRNPGEIVVISVAFFFSPRLTRVAHGLRSEYHKRLTHKDDRESRRAFFEVHTESHDPPLPDLMKLDVREVRRQHLAHVLFATALDLMVIPEQDGQQILFGVVDTFGRVQKKVESGMVISAAIREAAGESTSRFGHAVPVEVVALVVLYLDSFIEGSLAAVIKLVADKIQQDRGLDLTRVLTRLQEMSGQCFLLSGRREDDATYKLFDQKTQEAGELAKRLADRSSL
jgi:hypothetical protein